MQDPARAQEFAPRALQAAQEAKMPVYIGMAMANQGWIFLQQGEVERAESELRAAQAYFPTNSFPFYSIVALPLIAIYLPRGELDEAADLARKVIHPSQRKLPDPVEASRNAAIQAFEAGDRPGAQAQLELAIRLARDLKTF